MLAKHAPDIIKRPLPINVSGAIPAVMLDAGWPLEAMRGIPLLARSRIRPIITKSGATPNENARVALAAVMPSTQQSDGDTRQISVAQVEKEPGHDCTEDGKAEGAVGEQIAFAELGEKVKHMDACQTQGFQRGIDTANGVAKFERPDGQLERPNGIREFVSTIGFQEICGEPD